MSSEYTPSGERVSVSKCTLAVDYLVDCEDGNPPRKMTFKEVRKGKFKFRGEEGSTVELEVSDFVLCMPPEQVQPASVASRSDPEPQTEQSVTALPPAADDNCMASGQIVIITPGSTSVVCWLCNAKHPIPKEMLEAKKMLFPDHRHQGPPVALKSFAAVPPLSEAAKEADVLGHARKMEPADKALAAAVMQQAQTTQNSTDGVFLHPLELDVLVALFRDRALAIPRAAFSTETVKLLQRLGLVD